MAAFPPVSTATARRATAGACGHERGMVLWLTLVAMLFFAALVAYVANLGDHAVRQQETQDAADAAATGAAGEVARTLNLVAQNNIGMTRLLVSAQLLDAMPQSVEYTLSDAEAHYEAVSDPSLPRPVCAAYPQLATEAANYKAQVIDELKTQVTELTAMNRMFQGTDVRETSWYTTPSGQRGALWKAMLAMDEVSQAALTQMPVSAQAHAVACGAANIREPAGALAGVAPFRCSVPCQRGAFDDFYKPVTTGWLPDASGGTDNLNHRGPCDALFGWVWRPRVFISDDPQPPRPPTRPSAPTDGSPFGGNNPGGGGPSGHFESLPEYRTYGFFRGLNDTFRDTVGWINSGLASRVRQMALLKLAMAQGGAAPWQQLPQDLGQATAPMIPKWITPSTLANARAEARRAGNDPNADINRAEARAYWVRYDENSTDGRMWGWTTISQRRRYFGPNRIDLFLDAPETAFRVKLGEGMYVTFTPEPILDPQTGAQIGVKPTYPVYYFWAGIDTGNERATIANPNNWGGSDPIPAPTDLLPEYATPPTAVVPGQWCVLGFAAQQSGASGMGRIFKTAGHPRHASLAQARVFNNHSWDLWTPMWHAQLAPVEQYATWLATMQQTASEAGGDDGMNTAELPGFVGHLDAIKPLAPLITH